MLAETNLLAYFAELEDPRRAQNRRHPLINILSIAILGVISGADTWVDIERYGVAKEEWLSRFLDLENGIPSHDTFGRVFRWLDEEAFETSFTQWTLSLCEHTAGELVAVDGKKLRGSHDRTHSRDGIWLVSAWATANRVVLGQEKVGKKSNEITAVPELLKQLDITGCVVTLDALNTQTEIAQQIINAQADYIMAVKGNQATLAQDLQMLFEGFTTYHYADVPYDTAQTQSQGHHRQEFRQVWVVPAADYIAHLQTASTWSNLTSLIKLVTVRSTLQQTAMTTRYFISSWTATAHDFLKAIRDHWQIENGLHWVLDIAFREDEARIRKDHAPHNMAILRRIALNLLKQDTSIQVGVAAKRKMAGWDNNYLLSLVCP